MRLCLKSIFIFHFDQNCFNPFLADVRILYPLKNQNTTGFLLFPGGIKSKHLPETGYFLFHNYKRVNFHTAGIKNTNNTTICGLPYIYPIKFFQNLIFLQSFVLKSKFLFCYLQLLIFQSIYLYKFLFFQLLTSHLTHR